MGTIKLNFSKRLAKETLLPAAAVTVGEPEAEGVMGAVAKKIGLNFKRVTSEQAEALAEDTLGTGGFSPGQIRQRQHQAAVAKAQDEEELRRITAVRREAELRREEEERRRRRDAEEARYRRERMEEEERHRRESEARYRRDEEERRAHETSYSSRNPGPGANPFSSRNSSW